jgi:hypothetical protein
MRAIDSKDVGIIRVVQVLEDDEDKPYAEAFLNRYVACAYKSGMTYVALLEHVLDALEGEPEAAEFYLGKADEVPDDKVACVFFDSTCVVEETPVMTATEFVEWYHRQLN